MDFTAHEGIHKNNCYFIFIFIFAISGDGTLGLSDGRTQLCHWIISITPTNKNLTNSVKNFFFTNDLPCLVIGKLQDRVYTSARSRSREPVFKFSFTCHSDQCDWALLAWPTHSFWECKISRNVPFILPLRKSILFKCDNLCFFIFKLLNQC